MLQRISCRPYVRTSWSSSSASASRPLHWLPFSGAAAAGSLLGCSSPLLPPRLELSERFGCWPSPRAGEPGHPFSRERCSCRCFLVGSNIKYPTSIGCREKFTLAWPERELLEGAELRKIEKLQIYICGLIVYMRFLEKQLHF